jgi:small ligand-binding sensory domain FIST
VSARAALSQLPSPVAALEEAWAATGALLERPPSLVALFCGYEHASSAHELGESLCELAPGAAVLGACAADGVIGAARERQQGPALALLAATLPAGAHATPFHVQIGDGAEGRELGGVPAPRPGSLAVAVADPYTTPIEELIDAFGGAPLLGGFAGLGARGAARLFTNGGCADEGAVGVVLDGLPARPIVSQGARPIGPELVVTAAEGNLVLELAGRPALERMQQVIADLPLAERLLLENGLLIGLVI